MAIPPFSPPRVLRAEYLMAEINSLGVGREPTPEQEATIARHMRELDELLPKLTREEYDLLAWSEF